MATPANDGIANLMKYALALAPKTDGSRDQPSTENHDGFLTLTYQKNKTASDVTYIVMPSSILSENDWPRSPLWCPPRIMAITGWSL